MSISLMTLAWKSPLPAGKKMVLLALCDNANDQGECYPSVSTLAIKCSMGERTVQGHITDMEQLGIVRRELRNGRSTMYHINPGNFDATPAESAPPQNPHPTPAKSAQAPPQNLRPSPANLAPRNIKEPSGKPSGKREKARGTRLPENWILPKSWGVWALEKRAGWNEEHVREVADAFRDHWIAKPGAGGVKLDWPATWRNWCRNARGPEQQRIAQGGPPWWSSEPGIIAKGEELGMKAHFGESMPAFKARVQSAIDNGGKEPPQRQSMVGRNCAPAEAPVRSVKPEGLDLKAMVGRSGPPPRTAADLSHDEEINDAQHETA